MKVHSLLSLLEEELMLMICMHYYHRVSTVSTIINFYALWLDLVYRSYSAILEGDVHVSNCNVFAIHLVGWAEKFYVAR